LEERLYIADALQSLLHDGVGVSQLILGLSGYFTDTPAEYDGQQK